MKQLLTLLFLAVLTSCSPYMAQIRQMERDCKAGKLSHESYYAMRSQLLMAHSQWQAQRNATMLQVSASMNQAAANINAANATMVNQQAVNAYNARTMMMARPQQVYHYGNIHHSHSGTLYLKGY